MEPHIETLTRSDSAEGLPEADPLRSIDRAPMIPVMAKASRAGWRAPMATMRAVDKLLAREGLALSHPVSVGTWVPWEALVDVHERLASGVGDELSLVGVGRELGAQWKWSWKLRLLAPFCSSQQLLIHGVRDILRQGWPPVHVLVGTTSHGAMFELLGPAGTPCPRSILLVVAGLAQSALGRIGLFPLEARFEAKDGYARFELFTGAPQSAFGRWVRRLLQPATTLEELHHEWVVQRESYETLLDTKHKALALALEDRSRALQARDRFLQAMGHEIRTPFNGLLNSLEALRSRGEGDSSSELEEAVHLSAERLYSALEAILSFAKVTSEGVARRPCESRPSLIVQACMGLLDAQRRAQNIQVCVDLDARCEETFVVDENHVVRALTEVLRNAIKFGPRGSTVEVRGWVQSTRLILEVEDQGAGIPPALRAEALRPFVQLSEGEAREHGGLGLGLALAHAKMQGIGGELEIDDGAAGGARVRLTVPLPPSDPVSQFDKLAGRRRVLVVDDDRVNRKVLCRLLRAFDCEMDEAEDGEEALAKLQNDAFDLVFMDCEMPRLDGWEATRRIRSDLALPLPVIATTAYASEADRDRCFQVGMNDFLAKPIDRGRLALVIARWFHGGGAP